MIGRVRYDDDGTTIVVTLGDDLSWSCPEWPDVAAVFNVLHGPDPLRSSADGRTGYAQLHAAAAAVEGEILDTVPADATDPDLLY